jgi:hypothetical protein
LLSLWPPSPLLRSPFARFPAHRRAITIITTIIITTTTTTGDLRDATKTDGPLHGAIFLCGVTKLLTANLARRSIAAEKVWKTDAL